MAALRAWLFNAVPKPLREAPFEALVAAITLPGSLSLALGRTPPPQSIARVLPHYAQLAWGVSMCLGSLLILLGLGVAARAHPLWLLLRGQAIERLGLILLGWVMVIFGAAALVAGGWRGISGAAVILAYSAACGIRVMVLAHTRRVLWGLTEADPIQKGSSGE